MWIFSFRKSDVYWFHAGKYTAGRKDSDILILDDMSISRIHLQMEWSPEAPSLRLTDTSKYGSKVTYSLNGKPVEAKMNNSSHDLPCAAVDVELLVGNHDAIFQVRWKPLRLLINQGIHLLPADILRLKRCGCEILNAKFTDDPKKPLEFLNLSPTDFKNSVKECEAILSGCVEPTPLAIASLCAGKPFIGTQYFESVCARLGPKIPLLPTTDGVAFPKTIHRFWGTLLPGGTSEEPAPVPPSLFLPRLDRSRLMSLETFVVLNTALDQEGRQYIPLTGGHVASGELEGEDQLRSFINRHGSHTLLYHGDTPSEVEQLVMDKLPSLSYQSLLGKILQCEGLERGRRSRAEPLFEDDVSPKRQPMVAEPSIWRTNSALTAVQSTVEPSDQTVDDGEYMVFDPAGVPLSMPSFPCFASVVSVRNNAVVNTQKVFRKQRIVPSSTIISFEEAERPRMDPTRTIVSIDDDNIIPDHVAAPQAPAGRFNRFDTAVHHRVQRSAKRPRETAAPTRSPARAPTPPPEAIDPALSIFAVDNLY